MRGEFVDIGRARLYYYASGTRGRGEPVLFVHGFLTSSHLWHRLVPLIPQGLRMVVPDLLGFGRSAPPDDAEAAMDLSIQGHAQRLGLLLDALGIERTALVAHGVGAAIGLRLLAARPARVASLALVNPCVVLTRHQRTLLRAIPPALRLVPPALLLSLLARRLDRCYTDRGGHSQSLDQYLRPFQGSGGRRLLVAHLRALAASPTRLDDIVGSQATTATPTAIVVGDSDSITPEPLVSMLRDRWPHATIDRISGGHFGPEESPDQLARVLSRFLVKG
jgi:pimeloyl-ACP methyl ester carboxylesterase